MHATRGVQKSRELYAEKVVFLDDWQFSLGCSYEFLVACRTEISTVDESLKPISIKNGISLLSKAVAGLKPSVHSVDFLRNILEELRELEQHS